MKQSKDDDFATLIRLMIREAVKTELDKPENQELLRRIAQKN